MRTNPGGIRMRRLTHRDGSRIWRSGSELSIHAATMVSFRVHVWLHVLGSQQTAGEEALVGQIQLDRKDYYSDGCHNRIRERACTASAHDPDCANKLVVDSDNSCVRHRARPSARSPFCG